jgi:hypothetical protein
MGNVENVGAALVNCCENLKYALSMAATNAAPTFSTVLLLQNIHWVIILSPHFSFIGSTEILL